MMFWENSVTALKYLREIPSSRIYELTGLFSGKGDAQRVDLKRYNLESEGILLIRIESDG